MKNKMPTKKLRILLVDDEPQSNIGLTSYLRRDFEIVEFEDTTLALEFIKNETIDIIIADQKMPIYSGLDFLKKCMIINPNAIRIIITGHVNKEHFKQALEEGVIFRLLHKPISIEWDKFDRLIEDAVRHHQQISKK